MNGLACKQEPLKFKIRIDKKENILNKIKEKHDGLFHIYSLKIPISIKNLSMKKIKEKRFAGFILPQNYENTDYLLMTPIAESDFIGKINCIREGILYLKLQKLSLLYN